MWVRLCFWPGPICQLITNLVVCSGVQPRPLSQTRWVKLGFGRAKSEEQKQNHGTLARDLIKMQSGPRYDLNRPLKQPGKKMFQCLGQPRNDDFGFRVDVVWPKTIIPHTGIFSNDICLQNSVSLRQSINGTRLNRHYIDHNSAKIRNLIYQT